MSLKERVSGGGSDARVTRPHPVSNVRFGPYSSAPATPHRSVSQLTRPTNQTIRAADQLSVDHSMFGYEMRRFDFRCCRTDDLLLFPREGDLNDPDLSHAALRKGDAALLDRYQASIIARTKAQLSVKAPSSEASDYASSKSGRSTSKTSLRTSISTPPTFACRNQNPKSTNPRVPVDAGKPPNQATAFPSSLRSARPTEVVGPAEDSAKTDPPACDSPVKDVETKELCGSPLCDKAVKSDESLPEVPKDAWNLISKSWDSTVRVCPLPPFDEEDETIHLNISTLLPQESGYSLTFPEPSSSATPSSISTGGDSSFTPSKSSEDLSLTRFNPEICFGLRPDPIPDNGRPSWKGAVRSLLSKASKKFTIGLDHRDRGGDKVPNVNWQLSDPLVKSPKRRISGTFRRS